MTVALLLLPTTNLYHARGKPSNIVWEKPCLPFLQLADGSLGVRVTNVKNIVT